MKHASMNAPLFHAVTVGNAHSMQMVLDIHADAEMDSEEKDVKQW